MRTVRVGLIAVLVLGGVPVASFAADVAGLVKAVKAVGPEGQGNAAAAKALAELSKGSADDLLKLLPELDDASPRATNYLRAAVQNIAQKSAGKLPVDRLEAFLKDRAHSADGRKLAYDLIAQADAKAAEGLVPGFIDDPSAELRRLAVEALIGSANKLFDEKKLDEAKPIYQKAMQAARDDDQVKLLVEKLETYGEKINLTRHFGFLTTWWMIGPFDNKDKKGFDVAYEPEKKVDLKAELEGKDGKKLKWVQYTAPDEQKEPDNCGIVDVKKPLENHKGAIAYAYAEVDSPREQTVDLRLGTSNAWKVWLNGQPVFGREEYHRGEKLDQYKMWVTLKPGRNTILVKVCQNEQTEEWAQRWQFRLRICDSTGTAVLPTPQTAGR